MDVNLCGCYLRPHRLDHKDHQDGAEVGGEEVDALGGTAPEQDPRGGGHGEQEHPQGQFVEAEEGDVLPAAAVAEEMRKLDPPTVADEPTMHEDIPGLAGFDHLEHFVQIFELFLRGGCVVDLFPVHLSKGIG